MRDFILKARYRLALFAIDCVQRIRVQWYALLSTSRVEGRPRRWQPLQVAGEGRILIGANVHVGFFPSPGFLDSYAYIEARRPAARIEIGPNTIINNGFRCIADNSSITIGANCLIGPDVEILDSDFHGVNLAERRTWKPEWCAPVVLEDNVFIGSHVRILKGVRIGVGAVIANSSVVTADIPPMVVAGGVPAKVLRAID